MSALKENPMMTKILSCFNLACLLALSLFADRCLAQEPTEKNEQRYAKHYCDFGRRLGVRGRRVLQPRLENPDTES